MDHIKTLVPREVRKEMVDTRISMRGVHAYNCVWHSVQDKKLISNVKTPILSAKCQQYQNFKSANVI